MWLARVTAAVANDALRLSHVALRALATSLGGGLSKVTLANSAHAAAFLAATG
jgi:hypothetical protein